MSKVYEFSNETVKFDDVTPVGYMMASSVSRIEPGHPVMVVIDDCDRAWALGVDEVETVMEFPAGAESLQEYGFCLGRLDRKDDV